MLHMFQRGGIGLQFLNTQPGWIHRLFHLQLLSLLESRNYCTFIYVQMYIYLVS